MSRSLSPVDWLAVGYLGGSAVLLASGWGRGWVYPVGAGLHVGLLLGIVVLGLADPTGPLRSVRALYPLGLLLVIYVEVDLYVRLLHDPTGYDATVRAWDAWLFGGHPHTILSEWLSGWFWRECFHALYLSYYVLLIGSFLAFWAWWPHRYPHFAFVVTGMFLSFVGVFLAVPVAGPLSTPGTDILSGGVFPRLTAWLYVPLRMDGIATGAFPSSHVGMAVGVACLLRPRSWALRLALWGLVLGIAVSTVYGQFHYAVDAVAGGVAGGLLYLGWTAAYGRLTDGRAEPARERRADPAPRRPLPDVEARGGDVGRPR